LPYCVPLPLDELQNFNFFLDGEAYAGGFEGCMNDSTFSYTYFPIPDRGAVGPYQVTSWRINEMNFSGGFNTLDDLLDSMNVWDATGEWRMDTVMMMFKGGNSGTNYGSIDIVQINTNAQASLDLNRTLTPNGTRIRIPVGTHTVVIQDIVSNCLDTLQAVITCKICPELYEGPTTLDAANCDSTNICLSIEPSMLDSFIIELNGSPYMPTLCTPDTLQTYSLFSIPGDGVAGPYTINWSIDSLPVTGSFDSLPQLVSVLNQLDNSDGRSICYLTSWKQYSECSEFN